MGVSITDLSSYTTPTDADVLPIVDVSTGVTKKITATSFVNAFLPSGAIMEYAGASAPSNWLLCNGAEVSRATYAALFTAIGTAYGVGDGSTTFNIPDMRGKTVVGKSSDSEFLALGQAGGSKTHALSASEMPSHTHTGTTSTGGSHTHNYTRTSQRLTKIQNPSDTTEGVGDIYTTTATTSSGSHSHTFTTASSGSSAAHNNLQPYVVTNFIIKV